MVNYGAAVSIGGLQFPDAWDGSALIALDRIQIDWGRESPYDDANPATCQVKILDRYGDWFSEVSRIGEDVQIVRTGANSRRVFWGQVTEVEAERVYLVNPQTDREEAVWIVTLSVQDKLGMAGGTVVEGPMGYNSYEGSGGWGEAGPVTRAGQMLARGALDVFSGGHQIPEDDLPSNVRTTLHGIKGRDSPTVLELLHTIGRTRPLGAVEYVPSTDLVRRVQYALSTGVRFTRVNGLIVVAGIGSTVVVPASSVATEDGYNLTSTVQDAIESITVTGFYYGRDSLNSDGGIEYKDTTQTRAVSGSNMGTRNVTVDSSIMSFDESFYPAGQVDNFNRGKPWLSDQMALAARRLNGWMHYPELTLNHPVLPDLPATVADQAIDTVTSPSAWYLSGSVYAGITTVPPQVQMIGGVLTYEAGNWTQKPVLIPAVDGTVGAPPSLSNAVLFGNSTATWADFDPTVTWADFGNVTQGLSA